MYLQLWLLIISIYKKHNNFRVKSFIRTDLTPGGGESGNLSDNLSKTIDHAVENDRTTPPGTDLDTSETKTGPKRLLLEKEISQFVFTHFP